MAYDEGLAFRVRELIAEHPGMAEKRMFGGLAFLLNGNLACGVQGEHLIVRLPADATDAALGEPGTEPFDLTGRKLSGWILVGPDAYSEDDDLSRWVERGLAFAGTLPPK
jgi:TfoX/Sxy family transcriptional regulator of competence genes